MKTEADEASEHDCPSCDQGKLQLVTIDFAATLPDGKELIVPSLLCEQCDTCGERAFDKAARQLIDAAIVKAMGTLTPDQVEKFVSMTGLREDELCECLGLGAKTIYRWRRGAQRPSQSLSILLAMVAHHPNLLGWVQSGRWRQSPAEPERYFPTLDSHWEELRIRFPHSQGRQSILSAQDDEEQRPARFNPAIGLCAAEVE